MSVVERFTLINLIQLWYIFTITALFIWKNSLKSFTKTYLNSSLLAFVIKASFSFINELLKKIRTFGKSDPTWREDHFYVSHRYQRSTTGEFLQLNKRGGGRLELPQGFNRNQWAILISPSSKGPPCLLNYTDTSLWN
jgi:hypothetical protein